MDNLGLGDVLYEPANAQVDIVFVHGLGGNRISTWTSHETAQTPGVFWPRELLPAVCPTARILSFGYDASFAHFYPLYGPRVMPVGTTIDDHSTSLFQSLISLRRAASASIRPILFVAHSLGGLICANALARQHGPDAEAQKLVANTRGVIFLGTPFAGSSKALWGSVALKLLAIFSSTNSEKIKDLEERSAKLVSVNEMFLKFLRGRGPSIEVACLFENRPMYVAKKSIGLIVPKDSAVLPGYDGLTIDANHVDMCKFEGDYVEGFRLVAGRLALLIEALSSGDSGNSKIMPASVHIGDVVYHGQITENKGVVAGTVYSEKEHGISIVGQSTTNYNNRAGVP